MSRAEVATLSTSDNLALLPPRGYLERSELPLVSLVFLLPLIATFEFEARYHTVDPIALQLLARFFGFFGIEGRYTPMLAVIFTLLCWHAARRDSWRVGLPTLGGMALESILLALPLLVLRVAVVHWQTEPGSTESWADWRDLATSSLGAGIYEEFIFRLAALTIMHLIFVDFLRLPRLWANPAMVVAAAILFSAYHYLGREPFDARIFAFRTVAGIYFGTVFLTRGFGVTAGTHAAYDVILASLLMWNR
jgi:hypothetical protein